VGARAPRARLAGVALHLLCATAFLVLLCMKVDEVLSLPYTLVFCPLYVVEASALFRSLLRLRVSAFEAERARIGPRPYLLYAARILTPALARASLALLVPLRLDGALHCSWLALSLPAWLLLSVEAAAACAQGVGAARGAGEKGAVERRMARGRAAAILAGSVPLLALLLQVWPLQDIVSFQGFCGRVHHPNIAPPPDLHCPHGFNTNARLLRSIRPPPPPPFRMPYTIRYL